MCAPLPFSIYPLVIVCFNNFKRNKKFASITPHFHQELSRGLLQGWIRAATNSILPPTRVPAAGYKLCLSWVPAAGYKLRLSRILATEYKLRLTPSYSWLELKRRLDATCSWFYPATNSSSSGWIRIAADSVPQMTRVPATGYDLRLIPSCSWLWVAADSILWLTRVRPLNSTYGWLRL